MTRKREMKLLMGMGFQRNLARETAHDESKDFYWNGSKTTGKMIAWAKRHEEEVFQEYLKYCEACRIADEGGKAE